MEVRRLHPAGRFRGAAQQASTALASPDILSPLALFVAFLLLRLPLQADFLVNWDAVNFALGTEQFSLAHHQPHPPGYIGYVAMGWLLNQVTGDPNASLTLISVLSGAVAPAALYGLARNFAARPYALIAAVLFGLSPLVWYYSEVALTYATETALALTFLWAAHRARKVGSVRHLLLATLLLALLGAVRQSGAALLLPVWLLVAWPFAWRVRAGALGVLVAANLAWAVPLLVMAGGPAEYMRQSAELTDIALEPSSVFNLGSVGLLRNAYFVGVGLVLGLNVGLGIITAAALLADSPLRRFRPWERWFLVLWVVPTLLMYLLIHIGQLGYILVILPLGFLWVGIALEGLAGRPWRKQMTTLRRMVATGRLSLVAATVGLFLVVNVVGFLRLPYHVFTFVEKDTMGIVGWPLGPFPHGDGEELVERARQFDLRLSDKHWKVLTEFIQEHDPRTVAVLASPDYWGSFRHLSYYLRDYHVYAVGWDDSENLGHMFSAYGGVTDYRLDQMDYSAQVLDLPQGVRTLILPDIGVYDLVADLESLRQPSPQGRIRAVLSGQGREPAPEPMRRYTVELSDGTHVVVLEVPSEAAVWFRDDGGWSSVVPVVTGERGAPDLSALSRRESRVGS